MRICYLSGSKIPSLSANSIQVMRMCEAFADQGHEVTLIAQSGDDDRDACEHYGVRRNFAIIRLALSGHPRWQQWGYARQAFRLIRQQLPIDLVYGRHLPGLVMASRLKTPIIYETHAPARRTGKLMESWLFRRPNFVQMTAISQSLRRDYLRKYPTLSANDIVVARSAFVAKSSDDPQQLRQPGRRLQIGYSGHLYPGKGMEMVASLAARIPSFDFHVLGGDVESIARWRNATDSLSNLTLHGTIQPAGVSAWQRKMDVLIMPCASRVCSAAGNDIAAWTSPLKLFEYLGSGRAVVASDLPVLREVLQDGVNALLAPAEDVDAWEQKLRSLTDPGLRRVLAQRAVACVQRQHTWGHRARDVLRRVA